MFSKICYKTLLPSFLRHRLVHLSSGGKLPFEKKTGSSSPFERKLTNNAERSKRPQPITPKVEIKQAISQAIPEKKEEIKEKINLTAQSSSFPIDKEPPKKQGEVDVKIEPVPLDFAPLSFNTMSERLKAEQQRTTEEFVMSNIGLNRYLNRIYTTSGISLMISLASAYACISFPMLAEYSQILLIGGFGVSFLCFQMAQAMKPTYLREILKDNVIYRTKNDVGRLLTYGIGCVGMGISAAPLFLSIHEISNIILPMTMGITAAIFGGASLVALMLPKDSALGFGSVLGGGLIGLISLNLTGIVLSHTYGPNIFSTTLMSAESYLGIGLFSAMIVYDTHVAIRRYQKGDADHLGMSIQILLDLWNLIIRIATEIAKAQEKKKK